MIFGKIWESVQKRIFAAYSIAPRAFSVYNLRGCGVAFIV